MFENDAHIRMPRSVLVAPDDLYLRLAEDPNSVALLQDLDAMVVPYTRKPELNKQQVLAVRELLAAADQLSPGSLLIKNPYDSSTYVFAERAIETFARAKYDAIANVARLLGAREIHFVEAKIETHTTTWVAGIKAKLQVTAADGSTTKEVKSRLKTRLEGLITISEPETASDEAMAYIERCNLSGDLELMTLVRMRKGPGGLLKTRTMKMSGTQESEANIRSALSIANAGPMKAIQIAPSFTATAQSIREIEIITEIKF